MQLKSSSCRQMGERWKPLAERMDVLDVDVDWRTALAGSTACARWVSTYVAWSCLVLSLCRSLSLRHSFTLSLLLLLLRLLCPDGLLGTEEVDRTICFCRNPRIKAWRRQRKRETMTTIFPEGRCKQAVTLLLFLLLSRCPVVLLSCCSRAEEKEYCWWLSRVSMPSEKQRR